MPRPLAPMRLSMCVMSIPLLVAVFTCARISAATADGSAASRASGTVDHMEFKKSNRPWTAKL